MIDWQRELYCPRRLLWATHCVSHHLSILHLPRPATGQVLPPQTDLVTQTMRCVNSTHGEKGLLMKLRNLGYQVKWKDTFGVNVDTSANCKPRIGYVCNGTPVQEMGQIGGFPLGY